MSLWHIYTIISVICVSTISLVGVFTLSLQKNLLHRFVLYLVSLAAGALIGDALIHLIPESYEHLGNWKLTATFVLSGSIIFLLLEKILHWHHHEDDSDTHVHLVGKMVLLSDGLHNFLDGIIIAIGYTISTEIGIATTIAVILHEIPQEFGDFGVLLHAGYKPKRALFLNFVSACMSLFGAGTIFLLGSGVIATLPIITAIAAGGFLYIACIDLLPAIHKTNTGTQRIAHLSMTLFGIGIMGLLLLIE